MPDVELRFSDGKTVNPFTAWDDSEGVEILRHNADYLLGAFIGDQHLPIADSTYGST